MTEYQLFQILRTLGVDVSVLSFLITLLCALLKKTVLKNCVKKVFVFLPFLIGVIVYGAYRAIVTMSAAPFTDEIASTIERGIACGCAANIYYVIYEQFFRKGGKADPLAPLFEGYLDGEALTAFVEELRSGSAGKSGEELTSFVEGKIASLPETVSAAERRALTTLCAHVLSLTA